MNSSPAVSPEATLVPSPAPQRLEAVPSPTPQRLEAGTGLVEVDVELSHVLPIHVVPEHPAFPTHGGRVIYTGLHPASAASAVFPKICTEVIS